MLEQEAVEPPLTKPDSTTAALWVPPELLQEILASALLGQEPVDQQQTRNRFRLVCRDWYMSFNYWRNLSVVGSNKIGRLVDTIKSDQLGATPQRRCSAEASQEASIELDSLHNNDGKTEWPAATLLPRLLELLPALRRLRSGTTSSALRFCLTQRARISSTRLRSSNISSTSTLSDRLS
jgi:hypothetical protein